MPYTEAELISSRDGWLREAVRLRDELAAKDAEIVAFRNRTEALEKGAAYANALLQRRDAEIERLKAMFDGAMEQVRDTAKAWGDAKDEIARLREEVEKFRFASDKQAVAWKERALKAEAELVRLKPSGQVAEDEEQIRASFAAFTPTFQKVLTDRLARLAAATQESEALRQEVAALEADIPRWQENVATVEAERDSERRLRMEAQRVHEALRQRATKAAAELRHTYGHLALGQNLNTDLVARAIRILEEATKP